MEGRGSLAAAGVEEEERLEGLARRLRGDWLARSSVGRCSGSGRWRSTASRAWRHARIDQQVRAAAGGSGMGHPVREAVPAASVGSSRRPDRGRTFTISRTLDVSPRRSPSGPTRRPPRAVRVDRGLHVGLDGGRRSSPQPAGEERLRTEAAASGGPRTAPRPPRCCATSRRLRAWSRSSAPAPRDSTVTSRPGPAHTPSSSSRTCRSLDALVRTDVDPHARSFRPRSRSRVE